MNPQKTNMTVLTQVVKLIDGKIMDSLARKHKVQIRSFSPTSHVVTMLYAHLSNTLSLNDICDSLQNHAGIISQNRTCTPPI